MKELYKDIWNKVQTEHSNELNNHRNSRVLVVDGLNTFIRCWSSIPTMNDDGDHVAGVTGVLKSIGYAIKQVRPTRVIIVFDGKGGSQSRKKKLGSYKSNRGNNKMRVNRSYDDMMNEEDERESMKRQYVWLDDMLDELPVTTMIYDGVEADDVMGYIATTLRKEGEEVVLMSTDKDFLQLVNDEVTVWSPTKKLLYNKTRVKEEFGIETKNLLLYRVLDGDTSDNIPGVKGCGIKSVLKRIPELGGSEKYTVEDLLELTKKKQRERIMDKLKPIKLYETIIESEKQILLNRELMQLDNVDISGVIKMDILSKYDESTRPFNKMSFLQVCVKYKVLGGFGSNINNWLQTTFMTLITHQNGSR